MNKPDNPASFLADLFALFPPEGYLANYEEVPADQVPQPYHQLLVHEHHMTVTVEDFHGSLVDVRVLDEFHEADTYARKILLALQSTGRIVQFGLVRIHLHFCSDRVRQQILSRKTPLGRILIQNDVLRRIEPTNYLQITPGPDMIHWFGLDAPRTTFGRQAIIHCDEQPAIELLEIVAPE
jgi:chorismate-pyruvate lyase